MYQKKNVHGDFPAWQARSWRARSGAFDKFGVSEWAMWVIRRQRRLLSLFLERTYTNMIAGSLVVHMRWICKQALHYKRVAKLFSLSVSLAGRIECMRRNFHPRPATASWTRSVMDVGRRRQLISPHMHPVLRKSAATLKISEKLPQRDAILGIAKLTRSRRGVLKFDGRADRLNSGLPRMNLLTLDGKGGGCER